MIYSVFPVSLRCLIRVAICVVNAIQTSLTLVIDTIAKVVAGGFVRSVSWAVNRLLSNQVVLRAKVVRLGRAPSCAASCAPRCELEGKLGGSTARKYTLLFLPKRAPSRHLRVLVVKESTVLQMANLFRVIVFRDILKPVSMGVLPVLWQAGVCPRLVLTHLRYPSVAIPAGKLC